MKPKRLLALVVSMPFMTGCMETGSNYWLSLPYHNDFSGRCDLPATDDSVWTTACKDGRYQVLDKTSKLTIASVGLTDTTAAITVQADMGFIRGVETTTSSDITNYGISCLTGSSTTQPSGYLFVVSDDGVWAILRKTSRGWTSLADNLNGDRLPPSARAQVRGTCIASHGSALLTLNVNEQTIRTVRDNHPFASFRGFGVVVLTTQPNTATWFDNLRARTPTSAERAMREPAASPRPSSTAPHVRGTLFTDRFSRNLHVWHAMRNYAAHIAIRDGHLDIRVQGNSIEQTHSEILHPAPAVVVTADVREREPAREAGIGCTTDDGVGLLADVNGATHRYTIWAEQGNEGIRLAAGDSPAIRMGAVNHLVLHCTPVGEQVSLLVNGHRVARVSNDYADGAFTRVLLSVEATRRLTDAAFDNVVVREP